MPTLLPVVPQTVPCKCCGQTAGIYGVVDFNKNCEANKNSFPLKPAGVPIYYHRCSFCGLLFTLAFDSFSHEDYAEQIYNSAYPLVDPEYAQIRPVQNARNIGHWFGRFPEISILDYGGGNGKFSEQLKLAGFVNLQTYDPFVPEFSTLPKGKFQLILAYEVFEHSPAPMPTFEQILSFLDEGGMILFTTLPQPSNFDQIGLNWWYVAPRNGHVTLYSDQCLKWIAQKYKMQYVSWGPGYHVLLTSLPVFAGDLLKPG